MVVFGTRPEAIKLAPLVRALADSPDFQPVVVVTGQHREILDQVLHLFDVKPDVDLDIIESRQTMTQVTTRALAGLEPVVASVQPDMVVVQGDTTTTFAGALAAFYQRVPVTHVEAGLRTGDITAPYPEEMNRRLTTRLAVLHLAPTSNAKRALLAEGVPGEHIVVTGNTVIDALRWAVGRRVAYGDSALADLDNDLRPVLLVTAHRRESWGQGMRAIGHALGQIARDRPELLVVFPIHPNPVVREAILPAVVALDNVRIIEPLPYGAFARLMARSHLILTDSGGVQEEGPSLGKPVLVMRDTTERPEAVAAGTARLVGTNAEALVTAVGTILDDPDAYAAMANAVNPYGDGQAARRSLAALAHIMHGAPAPDEFTSATGSDAPPR
ncbi:MAG TPA: UDP-N-acetylglucosamine 2-epimerase (non-hydrolyzing) [Egibacteraceae bacterium]|nr:UDP-N-acetylglucosamine 2-epimerase (non-hydrolyzing) [Egibacteraceae bacterium]